MNKYITKLSVMVLLLGSGYILNGYLSEECNTPLSSLALNNIEALARDESAAKDYWCCGNTSDCVTGPNFVIKGKFSESPCK